MLPKGSMRGHGTTGDTQRDISAGSGDGAGAGAGAGAVHDPPKNP